MLLLTLFFYSERVHNWNATDSWRPQLPLAAPDKYVVQPIVLTVRLIINSQIILIRIMLSHT